MENPKICELCLAQILDDDFENVDFEKVENLKILNLQITLNDDPIVCSKCVKNFQQSLNFKSRCLSNNEYLKTLLYPGDTSRLNLEEIFMRKIKSEVNYENKKVCRFCLQPFESTSLVELENKEQNALLKDMLDKCLPEIDLYMTEMSLICHGCTDLLENQFKFVLNCQDNELLKTLKKENVDVDVKSEDCIANSVKIENENFERIKNYEFQIKVDECLDCNEERKQTRNDRNIFSKFPQKDDLNNQYILQYARKTKQYKCDKCSFVTKWKQSLNRHYIHHMKPSEISMYKCTYCPYQFKFRWDFLTHSRQHMSKEDLEKDDEARKLRTENRKKRVPTIFICEEEECTFRTNQKIFLDIHLKKHKDYDETGTYICNECGFETKYKYHLTTHFKVHKKGKKVVKRQNIRISKQHKGNEPNDVQEEPSTNNSYQICSFLTEKKDCLKNQSIVQENDSTGYKCTECPFQTKYKMSYIFHSQKHVSDRELEIQNDTGNSDLQTVQCMICDYRTGFVSNLKRHYRLKHKNDTLDASYSCLNCDYKTKFEFELESHRRIHKPVYKCDKCSYITKMGHHFRNHIITHMKLSEVETFTCHICGFVTKFKKNIIAHVKRHQTVSETISPVKVESIISS